MLKASSRWLLVYLVLFGIVGLYSASASTLTDVAGSPWNGIPTVWAWQLDLQGDVLALDDKLIIENDSDDDWSKPGAWTASSPNGWRFWRDPTIPAQNLTGVTQLVWLVDDPVAANATPTAIFSVTAVGAIDDTGTWKADGSSGSVLHVPQVPEAGTLSLLAAGLLVGGLLKWRKKQAD